MERVLCHQDSGPTMSLVATFFVVEDLDGNFPSIQFDPAHYIFSPPVHQCTALVKQVGPHVSCLRGIAHVVGKGGLGHRPGRRRTLNHPVSKAGAEPVGDGGDSEAPEQG